MPLKTSTSLHYGKLVGKHVYTISIYFAVTL